MQESKLFGDNKGRAAFLRSLERMLMQGRGEDALSTAMQWRRHPAVDDSFVLPDPWQVIESARIRGYSPSDQGIRGERFLPFIDNNPAATAISFDLSSPFHFGLQPDENGVMDPVIETLCFDDGPYPFSKTTREAIDNDCVAFGRSTPWQGEQADGSASLSIENFGSLYGARCRLPEARTPEQEDLFALESAIAAISFYLVVKKTILECGAPRPLTFLIGSHDDYPFFNGVVFTRDELLALATPIWTEADRTAAQESYREAVNAYRTSRRWHWTERDRRAEKVDFEQCVSDISDVAERAARLVGETLAKPQGRQGIATAAIVGLAIWGHFRRNR